jgi:hypothetical protein
MNQHNFDLKQLLLVAGLAVVGISLFAACGNIGAARDEARKMQSSTQLRGIHQGLVVFANSNRNYFPGISASNENDGIEVESRFQTLMEGDFFTPEYAISPSETEANIVMWDGTSPVVSDNYSFAMLQLPDDDPENASDREGRRTEWAQTLNSQAIAMSDRNLGTPSQPGSVYADPSVGWHGAAVWNDNAVMFETDEVFETKYDGGELNPTDDLFEAESDFDAWLIHSGN